MNSANFMDTQNSLIRAYQLNSQSSKDILLANGKSVHQLENSSPSLSNLKDNVLSFNNQVASLASGHYLQLNRTPQTPSETFFHTPKSINTVPETYYANLGERLLSNSLIPRNLQNSLSNTNLLAQHWPTDVRNAAHQLSPNEASPNINRQQNPLEEIIMAHIQGKSALNAQSNSINSNNAIYSQYLKSQSIKNHSNLMGTPHSHLPKAHEKISQTPSPSPSITSQSHISNSAAAKSLNGESNMAQEVKPVQNKASREKSMEIIKEANGPETNNSTASSNPNLMIEEKSNQLNLNEDSEIEEEHDDSASDSNNKANRPEPPKKKVRLCFNVYCITDPTDATLWCRQKVRNSNICKQCFEAFKKEQYCYFCYQIYDDNSSYSDGKEWIECDGCNHWHHIECETAHGIKNIQELLKDDETFKYNCPICRLPSDAKSSGQKTKANKNKYDNQETTNKKSIIQDFNIDQNIEVKPAIHDNFFDENDSEEIITKKVRLDSYIQEENCTVIQVTKELYPALTHRDMIKKKLDSTINRTFLNKKKLQTKPPLTLAEFSTEIERLICQYGGRRLQLSENEIKADLNLFRELSGSTCTTDEKSSRSGEQTIEKVIDIWDEQSRSDYGEEERYPRRNQGRNQNQAKLLRSNKKPEKSESIFQDYNFEVKEKTRGTRGRKRGKGRGGRIAKRV